VPKLKGLTVKGAKHAIRAGSCGVGTIVQSFSRTVGKGRVIAQRQAPNKKLPNGAKVAFTVSKGSRPRS
jgi:beta-lactam-binding protein with PASTA domain